MLDHLNGNKLVISMVKIRHLSVKDENNFGIKFQESNFEPTQFACYKSKFSENIFKDHEGNFHYSSQDPQ